MGGRDYLQRIIHYLRKIFYKKSCFNKLKKSDAIIIGGGELISNGNVFFNSLLQWINTAKKYKVPIFMFSVGVVGGFSELQTKLLKSALSDVELIYTRDSVSAYKLNNILSGDTSKIKVVPDSVFSLTCKVPKNYSGVLFGITDLARHNKHKLIPFESESEQFDYYLGELTSRFNAKEVSIFYNNNGDKKTAKKFIAYAKSKGIEFKSFLEIENENEFIRLISECQTVFSPRMHACILGLVMEKEVFPVVLSEKMKSFYDTYFNENLVLAKKREIVTVAADELKEIIFKY